MALCGTEHRAALPRKPRSSYAEHGRRRRARDQGEPVVSCLGMRRERWRKGARCRGGTRRATAGAPCSTRPPVDLMRTSSWMESGSRRSTLVAAVSRARPCASPQYVVGSPPLPWSPEAAEAPLGRRRAPRRPRARRPAAVRRARLAGEAASAQKTEGVVPHPKNGMYAREFVPGQGLWGDAPKNDDERGHPARRERGGRRLQAASPSPRTRPAPTRRCEALRRPDARGRRPAPMGASRTNGSAPTRCPTPGAGPGAARARRRGRASCSGI